MRTNEALCGGQETGYAGAYAVLPDIAQGRWKMLEHRWTVPGPGRFIFALCMMWGGGVYMCVREYMYIPLCGNDVAWKLGTTLGHQESSSRMLSPTL